MRQLRFPPTSLLLATLSCAVALGCRAQAPPSAALTPQQQRQVELTVRSTLNVPADWEIAPEARTPSEIPGYDTLRIDFYQHGDAPHKQTAEFLLSKDGSTLARLSKYDMTKLAGTNIATSGRPVRGSETAKVEIINYDDLECPYCARMHAELFPATLDHYKGLVKVVYKDDPLVEIHPWALHAAVDANCLASQNGKSYWNYVDYLHTHGDDVTGPDRDVAKSEATLDKLAQEEGARGGLNKTALTSCLTRQDDAGVRASMQEAESLNIDGTPALFIDGERVMGAQPLPAVWAAIDRALRAQGVTPPPEPAAATAATPGMASAR